MEKGIDYTGIAIVYYCHDGKRNFLLQKRSSNCRDEIGNWDIGAGALELRDTIENTLMQEIKQEYATDILEYEFLGYRDVHRENNQKQTHWIALDFKVLVDREKAANGEPHKFDKIGWFTLDQLPTPLHSQLPYFINKYKNRL